MKKLIALACAALLCLSLAVTAYGATAVYSVSVSKNWISFLKNGAVTGGYGMKSNDVTLATGDNGDLIVCFYNTQGSYVGVTLGSQETVTVTGVINSLNVHETFDRPVVVGSAAQVGSMTVNAPVKVSVWGRVGSLSVNDRATVVAARGSVITKSALYDSGAKLYANEGSSVDGKSGGTSSSTSSTTSTGSGLTLRTNTIYASYGDTLRDLRGDLEDSVWAYSESSGLRVYGEVEWVPELNTEVTRSKSFSYRFIPDKSGYKTVTGTIRVAVDEGDLGLDMDIGYFRVNSSSRRLSSYLEDLEENVTAYNNSGKVVHGEYKWASPSKKVRSTGWYEFIFVPYSSRYATVRDEIKILVGDGDNSDDVFENDITLRISDIEVRSTTKRLRSLKTELKENVRAYDDEGKRLTGELRWVDPEDTRIRETGDYEFVFIPDDRYYGRVYDWITIYVDA